YGRRREVQARRGGDLELRLAATFEARARPHRAWLDTAQLNGETAIMNGCNRPRSRDVAIAGSLAFLVSSCAPIVGLKDWPSESAAAGGSGAASTSISGGTSTASGTSGSSPTVSATSGTGACPFTCFGTQCTAGVCAVNQLALAASDMLVASTPSTGAANQGHV